MYGRKDGVCILCGVNKNPFTLHDIFLLRENMTSKKYQEKTTIRRIHFPLSSASGLIK